MKSHTPDPSEDSSTVDKRRRHRRNMDKKSRCSLCPPHAGENATRWKRRSNNKKKGRR